MGMLFKKGISFLKGFVMAQLPVRVAGYGATLLAFLMVAAVFLIPLGLSPNMRNPLAATPAEVGLTFEDIQIQVQNGDGLPAWWIPAEEAVGAVVVAHDGSSNRSLLWEGGVGFLARLNAEGYSVLIVDLPGHGQSPDPVDKPTGANTETALGAALEEAARRMPQGPVYLHGFGLGGVIALYAARNAPAGVVAAVSVDSVWGDLKASMASTVPDVTPVPALLVHPSLWVADYLYGVDFQGSRPLSIAQDISAPVMLIVNAADRQVLPEHSMQLAKSVPNGSLWITPAPDLGHPVYTERGSWGTHTQSFALYPDQYVKKLVTFYQSASQVQS